MMITGEARHDSTLWGFSVPILGCYASGRSHDEAEAMLVEMICSIVKRDSQPMAGFKLEITADESSVYVTSNNHARLTAALLRYQRELHQLSLADVAAALGAKSRTSYTVYEQGKSEPTISKLVELLAVVAPSLRLTISANGVSAAPASKPKRRKAA